MPKNKKKRELCSIKRPRTNDDLAYSTTACRAGFCLPSMKKSAGASHRRAARPGSSTTRTTWSGCSKRGQVAIYPHQSTRWKARGHSGEFLRNLAVVEKRLRTLFPRSAQAVPAAAGRGHSSRTRAHAFGLKRICGTTGPGEWSNPSTLAALEPPCSACLARTIHGDWLMANRGVHNVRRNSVSLRSGFHPRQRQAGVFLAFALPRRTATTCPKLLALKIASWPA